MIVDLIRHGSTGRAGHFDGRSDPPLLADACEDLLRAHAGMAWSRIISSPRQRALHTAQALAAAMHSSVVVDEDWAEWHFGDWDGQHCDDIAREEGGEAALAAFYRDPAAFPPPNAEAWSALRGRIERGLRAIASAEDATPWLVVSHAGAIRLAISLACGWPLPALFALRVDYGTRVRLRLGIDAHDHLWGELLEVRQA